MVIGFKHLSEWTMSKSTYDLIAIGDWIFRWNSSLTITISKIFDWIYSSWSYVVYFVSKCFLFFKRSHKIVLVFFFCFFQLNSVASFVGRLILFDWRSSQLSNIAFTFSVYNLTDRNLDFVYTSSDSFWVIFLTWNFLLTGSCPILARRGFYLRYSEP